MLDDRDTEIIDAAVAKRVAERLNELGHKPPKSKNKGKKRRDWMASIKAVLVRWVVSLVGDLLSFVLFSMRSV